MAGASARRPPSFSCCRAKRTLDRPGRGPGARARAPGGARPALRLRRRALLGGAAVLRLRLRLRGGRGGVLLRAVLAVGRREALAAGGLFLPALAVVLAERVQRLALVLAGEDLLDRRLGLLERLLLGRGHLADLEDVVAELRLDRADELAAVGLEDRVVEGLLLLALGDAGELAALALRCLVDREALGDGAPGLAGVERLLGLLGAGLGLREHDAQVTPLGLRELR